MKRTLKASVKIWLIGFGAIALTVAILRYVMVDYLNTLAGIENIWCKIDLIEQIDFDRRVVLTVKFILDGTDNQGRRMQDRHFYRWHLANEGQPGAEHEWKIMRDELVEGLRVAGNSRNFIEADLAQIGIDYRHQRIPKLNKELYGDRLKFDVIEHSAGGVSAADYDNDSLPDIFFADGVRCRLYRNLGNNHIGELATSVSFSDVTHDAGLEGIDEAYLGIFADVDNDGLKDLFVTRYLAPNQFFRNNGDGTFHEIKNSHANRAGWGWSVAFFDYDNDADLDLYAANGWITNKSKNGL